MDGRLVLRLGLKHYLNELQDGQIMQLSRDALVKERATYNAFDTFLYHFTRCSQMVTAQRPLVDTLLSVPMLLGC